MQVEYLIQNYKDKVSYIRKFMSDNYVSKEEIGYLGDDLNDLPGMGLCGFAGCPADACSEVKVCADYVSGIKGGYGAVRDIVYYLLTERGEWEQIIAEVYGIGI